MTSETLYATLRFFDDLDTNLNLQRSLEAVQSALSSLVSQPAQPQFQATLRSALDSFGSAVNKLARSIAPSQFTALAAMKGSEFFDPGMYDQVQTAIQTNPMTPAVARDFVQDLAKRRGLFLTTVREARTSLGKLGIQAEEMKPGDANMAFLIPREIFDNQLAKFAKELSFISRLLQDFSEGLTGQAEQIRLEQLSSSIPTVALLADLSVIGTLAVVVNKFLDAWEKVERIRKVRAELTEMKLYKGPVADQLTEDINVTIDKVVEESTELVLKKYPGSPGRKNELDNAIRRETRRLFGQIERGLTVEFRAVPKEGGKAEQQKTLEDIANLSRVIKFPPVTKDPMLLSGGEILEGEFEVKHAKKTTTHKTTSAKKPIAKDDKTEIKT